MKCAGLILAAGGSSRLGHPKQLVLMDGKTLIERAVEQLIDSGCSRVYVVLGAYRDKIEEVIQRSSVEVVDNPDWQAGQSTSLRSGLQSVGKTHRGSLLVALCDQPLIPTSHYQTLRTTVASAGAELSVAATDYSGSPGVPACFSDLAWRSLSNLSGDSGAKKWLREQPSGVVIRFPCPEAEYDVDR